MLTKATLPHDPDKLCVTFSIPATIWADCIHLIGDFNNWNAASTPLRQSDECWSVSLLLERDRSYSYRYLVDHEHFMSDSQADLHTTDSHGRALAVVHTYA